MPPRMVAFDTESRSSYDGETEIQEWRVGCAIRWRTDLKTGPREEAMVFTDPSPFWEWVSDYTRPGTRTVVWAHNLGHDVRISRMFEILPDFGFHLEWCNLDRNISSATWRSDHGTIVLADTWTWIPMPLAQVAPQVGLVKYEMPKTGQGDEDWARYCMRDAEIVYHVVSDLCGFIATEGLGNWQPTGAGMAYATWRHKYMAHKVLVHDNDSAIAAERMAMHTGRAEAWRHGKLGIGNWTEVDLRNAYLRIAAESELPRKLHMHHGAISVSQYNRLRDRVAVLCRVDVDTQVPVVPVKINGRHVWPVGQFETWLWDVELDVLIGSGGTVKIREAYTYQRAPILSDWAQWVLSVLYDETDRYSSAVRTHIKHCSRALIGRISLRTSTWEHFGTNPDGITGMSYVSFPQEQRTARMLHVGQDTLIETARREGKDSLPMVTGWIMARCRMLLWEGMNAAGLENVAHVDTDGILVNNRGLHNMRDYYGDSFANRWALKGTYRQLEVWGPRAYWRDGKRVVAGIPGKATEVAPGVFAGEKWSALATDLETAAGAVVTVRPGTWVLKRSDPRRKSAAGTGTATEAYAAAELASANGSSDAAE